MMKYEDIHKWLEAFQSNWKKTLLSLICGIILIIIFVWITSYVSEKAKKHAHSSNDIESTQERAESTNEKKQDELVAGEKSGNISPQSLNELFESDFPDNLTVNQNLKIRLQNKIYDIKFRLHCNFESLTKFLSFYVPSSTLGDAPQISISVAQQASAIVEMLSSGAIVTGSKYDDRHTTINDLKFTGRIYIYHDAYLSPDTVDNIREQYKQNSLDPRFRGMNYLHRRFLYKRIENTK